MLNTIAFINEMDKLKAVLRQTKPTGLDRYENSAEHSWHTAMAAMVLLQDAPEGVDALQVLKLLLIHDVV
ncbi:MAG: HD domain-containing protein, partial [Pseudomonadota bacterium]